MLCHISGSLFLKAQMRKCLQSEVYRDSLFESRWLSQLNGIDALVEEHYQLDAFAVPIGDPYWLTDIMHGDSVKREISFTPSAVVGFPGIIVPADFVSGLQAELSFYGSAWSERNLLACAYFSSRSVA